MNCIHDGTSQASNRGNAAILSLLAPRVFVKKNQGSKPMFREIEGGRRLELKYIINACTLL